MMAAALRAQLFPPPPPPPSLFPPPQHQPRTHPQVCLNCLPNPCRLTIRHTVTMATVSTHTHTSSWLERLDRDTPQRGGNAVAHQLTWSKNRISVRVEQAVCASELKTENWAVRGGASFVPDVKKRGEENSEVCIRHNNQVSKGITVMMKVKIQ